MANHGDGRTNADIILRGGDGEAVTVRDVPVPVMQALYHEITGKTESLAKSELKDFIIPLEAIKQLFYKFEQTLEQFERRGTATTIVVRHKGGETFRYSSKEKFFQYDITKTDPIKGIDIEIDFLLSVPTVGKFHQYKIEVGIVSRVPTDDDSSDYLYGLGQIPLIFKISYVDYVVARTFLAAFDEWTKTLEIIAAPKFLEKLAKYDDTVANLCAPFVATSSVGLVYALFERFATQPPTNVTVWHWILILVATFTFFIAIGNAIASSFQGSTGRFGSFCHLLINRGDQKNYDKFLIDLKKRPTRILINALSFVGIVVVNACANILIKFVGL